MPHNVSSKSCCRNILEQRVGAREKNSFQYILFTQLPKRRWVHKHEKINVLSRSRLTGYAKFPERLAMRTATGLLNHNHLKPNFLII